MKIHKILLSAILMMFLMPSQGFSQNDKTVTLTVSAQGQTISEAKQNALRDAIEQAFGTFISSNTEILNDDLVKDEIVSVSNGNIQNYKVISEVELPNGGYATTLKASVSVTKLTSFVESKGVSVEFKGSLFAFNVNQQILNEKNEVKAIEDLCQVIRNIADDSFDYTITVSEPRSINDQNSYWKIPFYVSVFKNENFDKLTSLLYENLKNLSLTEQEAADYIKLDKDIYTVSIAVSENEYSQVFLRRKESVTELLETIYYFNHSLQNFKINNGIDEWSAMDYHHHMDKRRGRPKLDNRKLGDNLLYEALEKYRFQNGSSRNETPWIETIQFVHEKTESYSQAANIMRKLGGIKYIYDGGFRVFLHYIGGASVFYKGGSRPGTWINRKHFYLDGYQASTEDHECYPCIPITEALNEFEIIPSRMVGNMKIRYADLSGNSSFSFLHRFDNESNFVISFIAVGKVDPIYTSSAYKNYSKLYNDFLEMNEGVEMDKGVEIVRFYYEDIITLEEINKISEYIIKPLD